MNFYVTFFLPNIIGLFLYKLVTKEEKVKELIINYLIQVLFSNLPMMVVLIFRKHNISNFMDYVENNFAFALKYMLVVMVIGAVIGCLMAIIKKYFTFSVEVTNGRKKKN